MRGKIGLSGAKPGICPQKGRTLGYGLASWTLGLTQPGEDHPALTKLRISRSKIAGMPHLQIAGIIDRANRSRSVGGARLRHRQRHAAPVQLRAERHGDDGRDAQSGRLHRAAEVSASRRNACEGRERFSRPFVFAGASSAKRANELRLHVQKRSSSRLEVWFLLFACEYEIRGYRSINIERTSALRPREMDLGFGPSIDA